MAYPQNSGIRAGHGEISFILSKEDEEFLYKRSEDRLIIERKHTYSWARKSAILKDQDERGEIVGAGIILPILNIREDPKTKLSIPFAAKIINFNIDELF
jgi:hypothetical protein